MHAVQLLHVVPLRVSAETRHTCVTSATCCVVVAPTTGRFSASSAKKHYTHVLYHQHHNVCPMQLLSVVGPHLLATTHHTHILVYSYIIVPYKFNPTEEHQTQEDKKREIPKIENRAGDSYTYYISIMACMQCSSTSFCVMCLPINMTRVSHDTGVLHADFHLVQPTQHHSNSDLRDNLTSRTSAMHLMYSKNANQTF
jgi:hypothetical protein